LELFFFRFRCRLLLTTHYASCRFLFFRDFIFFFPGPRKQISLLIFFTPRNTPHLNGNFGIPFESVFSLDFNDYCFLFFLCFSPRRKNTRDFLVVLFHGGVNTFGATGSLTRTLPFLPFCLHFSFPLFFRSGSGGGLAVHPHFLGRREGMCWFPA